MLTLTQGFLLLFVGMTSLLIALSVPLMRGWVKPNRTYGLRTAKTLDDENVWYQGNAYGGRLFFRTGLVQLAAVVGLYFVPRLHDDFVAYNLACGAVIVGGVLLVTLLAIRYVRSL